MKHNNDPIKQENKKALPKFIAFMAVCLLGGLALGFAMVNLIRGDLDAALSAAGAFFTTEVAWWLLIALPVVELAVCLPAYFGAKKQLAAWDGEDEAVSCEIDARLSVCMWVTGMALILSLFLLAAMTSGFVGNAGTERDMGPVRFFGGLAAFLIGGLFVTTILQQKLVDLTKRLYPEKQGSVYDIKFQKWMVFALGGMFFSWGFLPAMAVCTVWGVGQTVYSYSCITLFKPGSSQAL